MNIELHGFFNAFAQSMRQRIVLQFEKSAPVSIFRRTVVTVVLDDVLDRFGKRVPFIRVYSDRESEFELTLPILRKIDLIADHKPSIILECCLLKRCYEL